VLVENPDLVALQWSGRRICTKVVSQPGPAVDLVAPVRSWQPFCNKIHTQ
jgi:hypothetical protein